MVDREDDLRIGVKSTAILFADYDRIIIGILQIVFHGLWLFLAIRLNNFWPFFIVGCLLLFCWVTNRN
ncbi:4-hydroxybenzoate-octaprenyltransferase [Legionella feeleii]|uniref:4-hydroxybenzoate-octaprenyltransferase n=2 Tax=Legionella feeleii TaxID=453 RepID=A0A2X1QZ84_9GAMM|nr:4-hydroxybenzoate-octaprenyltransferase [Legionella feeleii]